VAPRIPVFVLICRMIRVFILKERGVQIKLLPEKRMSSSYLRIDDKKIITDYIDITQYDVFKEITTSFTLEDYKNVDIDISGKEGKIILTVPKEKIISLLEKSKKMIQREEYIENILHLKTELVLKRLDT